MIVLVTDILSVCIHQTLKTTVRCRQDKMITSLDGVQRLIQSSSVETRTCCAKTKIPIKDVAAAGPINCYTDMDVITQFERRPEDDYYFILGCHDSASNEQILVEYKHLVLLCHPDKTQDDSSKAKFQKLQEAKEVLCDPEKRKDYDMWKRSGITITYKQWSMRGASNPVFHWATPKVEGRMLEEGDMNKKTAISTFNRLDSNVNYRSPQLFNAILTKFRNYEI